ncbi:MAG: hypothetical protein NUW37_20370 [Planctomycetes bacterium]|nr:hypothetical protein [Planctomycetota bacterium]
MTENAEKNFGMVAISKPAAVLGLLIVLVAVSVIPARSAPPPPPDTVAPARVDDLRIEEFDEGKLIFTWTAPGDDGTEGRARKYELAYVVCGVDDDNDFSRGGVNRMTPQSMILVPNMPRPGRAGSKETVSVTFDPKDSTLDDEGRGSMWFQSYWVLFAYDEENNVSRSRPALDTELVEKTCSTTDCHEDAWPQDSGKHDQHVETNRFKCVMCHQSAVDSYWNLLDDHDNGNVDHQFARDPEVHIYNERTKLCLEACHEERSWFEENNW